MHDLSTALTTPRSFMKNTSNEERILQNQNVHCFVSSFALWQVIRFLTGFFFHKYKQGWHCQRPRQIWERWQWLDKLRRQEYSSTIMADMFASNQFFCSGKLNVIPSLKEMQYISLYSSLLTQLNQLKGPNTNLIFISWSSDKTIPRLLYAIGTIKVDRFCFFFSHVVMAK